MNGKITGQGVFLPPAFFLVIVKSDVTPQQVRELNAVSYSGAARLCSGAALKGSGVVC